MLTDESFWIVIDALSLIILLIFNSNSEHHDVLDVKIIAF